MKQACVRILLSIAVISGVVGFTHKLHAGISDSIVTGGISGYLFYSAVDLVHQTKVAQSKTVKNATKGFFLDLWQECTNGSFKTMQKYFQEKEVKAYKKALLNKKIRHQLVASTLGGVYCFYRSLYNLFH